MVKVGDMVQILQTGVQVGDALALVTDVCKACEGTMHEHITVKLMGGGTGTLESGMYRVVPKIESIGQLTDILTDYLNERLSVQYPDAPEDEDLPECDECEAEMPEDESQPVKSLTLRPTSRTVTSVKVYYNEMGDESGRETTVTTYDLL